MEMTKREWFALEIAKAMATGNMKLRREVNDFVATAVRAADQLLAELNAPVVDVPPVEDDKDKGKGRGRDKDKDEDE